MSGKYLIAILFVFVVLLSGCTEAEEEPKVTEVTPEMMDCVEDSDCIPLPFECHAHSCINKKYENEWAKPEVCTEIFDCSSAYSAEDCECSYGFCLNKNVLNKGC
jgi:hypothetical protein